MNYSTIFVSKVLNWLGEISYQRALYLKICTWCTFLISFISQYTEIKKGIKYSVLHRSAMLENKMLNGYTQDAKEIQCLILLFFWHFITLNSKRVKMSQKIPKVNFELISRK